MHRHLVALRNPEVDADGAARPGAAARRRVDVRVALVGGGAQVADDARARQEALLGVLGVDASRFINAFEPDRRTVSGRHRFINATHC